MPKETKSHCKDLHSYLFLNYFLLLFFFIISSFTALAAVPFCHVLQQSKLINFFPSSNLFVGLVFPFPMHLPEYWVALCYWSVANFLFIRNRETLNCLLQYHWHNPDTNTSQWTGGSLINMQCCEEFHWSLSRSLNLYMFDGQ